MDDSVDKWIDIVMSDWRECWMIEWIDDWMIEWMVEKLNAFLNGWMIK